MNSLSGPLVRRLLLAAAALCVLGGAGAEALAQTDERFALVGGSFGAGRHYLVVYGPPGVAVRIEEELGDRRLPVGTVTIEADGAAWFKRGFAWRCDRRVRRFVATATLDGGDLTARFVTRTRSCSHRLALELPLRAAVGSAVSARVIDRWREGARARLCARPPAGRTRCRGVRIPDGGRGARVRLRLGQPGLWRFELRADHQRVRRSLRAGRAAGPRRRERLPLVLTVGDSMMQPLDVLLADRLGARADTRSYIRVGTGLSQPSLDWIARARLQAARLRPDAVVVFLGANEGLDMTTGTGIEVTCCGADWQAEYALRAAAIMRAYSRRGRARVVWLALPAPRQPERALIMAAVNAAARAAAVQLGGVRIVALDALLTPGFRYRAFMPVGGHPVRVRDADGVHLSLAGAAIAEHAVARALLPLR